MQEIRYVMQGICIAAALAVFGLLLAIARTYNPRMVLLRTYEEVGRCLRSSRNSLLDYQKLQEYLARCGAGYHFGEHIGPISFVALRLVSAGAGLLLASRYQLWAGIVLAFVCYWLPDILLVYLNNQDNERLLPEIKLVYHAIAMQIKAGVYVTDALAECYGSVKEKRLREALLTLSGDIAMKADVEEAMERFRGKFDNRYIDALSITVVQALESGQAVELLTDIAEQIKDMEVSIMSRRKSSLDRSITFYQLGILTAILGVILYACVTHMMSAAVNF